MRHAFAFWMRQKSAALWLIVVIGLATAVATAVWVIAAAVWFDRLPFAEPDRLVSVGWTEDRNSQRTARTSIEEFQDLKRTTSALYDLAGWDEARWYLGVGDHPVEINGAFATANLLDVLGVRPIRGRSFRPEDAQSGTIALISFRLWTSAFNRNADVVGRDVTIAVGSGARMLRVRIVGVLPDEGTVRLASADEVSLLVAVPDGVRPDSPTSRRAYPRATVARLKPGVTPSFAMAETTRVFREIDHVTGLFDRTRTANFLGLHEMWFGRTKPFLALFCAAAMFLLLVAATNAAGLMLALRSRRAREMSVRVAIGASHRHLIAQAVKELGVVGLGAAMFAVSVAAVLIRLFVQWGPGDVPRLSHATLDGPAILFAILMTTGCCLILGVVPVLSQRRRDVLPVLQSGGPTSTASRRTLRIRQMAIAVQVSIVLALLAAAGLVAGTLRHMLAQPLGFALDGAVVARVRPTQDYFRDPPTYARVMDNARRAALSVAGVVGAALTIDPPLAERAADMRVQFLDQPAKFVGTKMVSDGFFEVMRIPILAGRDFNASDMESGDAVIVNERFARAYFGGIEKAIGRQIDFKYRQRVVGVVGDVREERLVAPLRPIIYPVFSRDWTPGEFHVVARYRGGSATLVESRLDAALRQADPTAAVEVIALAERVRTQTAVARTQSAALGLLAVVVLLLAAVGIYATVAQVVEDRRRELGIRLALGATGRSLAMLMAGSVARASLTGLVGGAALSWVVARLTRGFLFEMTPFDPGVWGGAAIALLATAAVAAWWPARRAAAIEPTVVLRGE